MSDLLHHLDNRLSNSLEAAAITKPYFSLRKVMLIYIYGPWQPYCIQSQCISKKQTSPPKCANAYIPAINPFIVLLSANEKRENTHCCEDPTVFSFRGNNMLNVLFFHSWVGVDPPPLKIKDMTHRLV